MSRLVECMSRTDDRCFALYAGNLAIKFATKIDENKMSEQAEATEKRDTFPSQDGVKGHMAKRLCGQNLTKEDLDRHHLPAKYLKLFQNLSEVNYTPGLIMQ